MGESMRAVFADKGRFDRLVRQATWLNFAFVVVLTLAEYWAAERFYLTTLITLTPQAPFAIPAAVLTVVAIIRRMRLAIIVNLHACVLLLFGPLGFEVPGRPGQVGSSTTLRVMTYNIHQGRYGIDRVAETIDRYAPDIVCLQEVNSNGPWGDPVWQLQQLHWKRWHVVRDGELAILSRRPIGSHSLVYLPMGTMRAVLAAQVRLDGGRVTILNTHFNVARAGPSLIHSRGRIKEYLASAASVRLAQTASLLDFAGRFSGPVVITGDLNTPPRGLCYRRITSHYRDCFAAAGWGFGYTYSSHLPVLRIDYVLVDDSIAPLRCFTVRAGASDHRPVIADLEIAD